MKKIIIPSLIFAVALTACGAVAPTQVAVAPTVIPPTAEVIVVTVEVPVEVTVIPTAAAPEPVPTATLPLAPEPTEALPTVAAPVENTSTDAPIPVASSFQGGYFKDITYSNDSFSLRCQPKEITFTATATDPYIVEVDLFYRIEDRQGTYITQWKNLGKMQSIGDGKFTVTMSGESIHPDWRKALAWFDFQLVGINKQGDAVGRTEKIVQLVTYTIDCQP